MRTCVVFSAMQKFPTFDGIVLFLPWSVSNTGQLPWPSDQFPGRRGQRLGPENKEKNEQETSNPWYIYTKQTKAKPGKLFLSIHRVESSIDVPRVYAIEIWRQLSFDVAEIQTADAHPYVPIILFYTDFYLIFFFQTSLDAVLYFLLITWHCLLLEEALSMRQMQIKE